jgi:hypothetical protein
VKFLREKLTYANVMASLAVFLILGGATAWAALGKNTVGTKQLKNNAVTTKKLKNNAVTSAKIKGNAVTTAKIKNGAVTGAKVNVGTLGTVPSATSAGNANTVNGVSLVRFAFNHNSPVGPLQILNVNGLQLTASCAGGAVTLTATTTTNDSEISAENTNATENPATFSYGQFDDDFNPGDVFTASGADHTDIMGRVFYTSGTFNEVEVFFHEEDDIGGRSCILNGYAMAS